MLRAMLKKEFILILRDKHALAALFIMPSIFILIMSMALKDVFSDDRAFINYTVIDHDQSSLSKAISSALRDSETLIFHDKELSDQQIQEALDSGLQFVLTIPENYSARFRESNSSELNLHIDAASDVKQSVLKIFTGELTRISMQSAMQEMLRELEPILPGISEQSASLLQANSKITVSFSGMKKNQRPSSTQQSVPSWIVFGMFFIIIPMSTIFINERTQNTLMRMQAMNVSIPVLFAGKIVPYLVINQIQVWLMIAMGVFVVPLLGAEALTIGDSIAGLFMVSTGLSLAAIGTSILIAVSVNSVEQATTIGGIINILFGAIGGIMVPKFFMPHSMQTLTNISPMSWGLEGFLDIFLRGSGVQAVIPETLALAGTGFTLLLFAWGIFCRKTGSGL